MENYLGVKLVSAELCSQDQYAGAKNFGDLAKLHGGIDQEGYKVIYEDGYTSWSPKDVFEKAYRRIQTLNNIKIIKELVPHQIRVVDEATELNIKIEKLDDFILSNPIFKTLEEAEQIRLIQQVKAMQYYFGILVERINNF